MGFAQELKDFSEGYRAGAETASNAERNRQEWEKHRPINEKDIAGQPDEPTGGGASVPTVQNPSGVDPGTTGSTGGGRADVQWSEADPTQRAFLNTLAGPESGGEYNIVYGGKHFDDYSKHPGIYTTIDKGPNKGKKSSAAGKYQFLESTWNDIAGRYNLKDFSPANQDKAAWILAAETYAQKTKGGKLQDALASGDPAKIAQAGKILSPIWTSLPSGIEQGTTTDKFVSTFNKYLAEPGQTASPGGGIPEPQPEAGPGTGIAGQRDMTPLSGQAQPAAAQAQGFFDPDTAKQVNPKLLKVTERAARDNPGLFALNPKTKTIRSEAEQREMVDKGWSKTMNSKHRVGKAADLVPINPDTGQPDPDYTAGYSKIADAMRKAAQQEGITDLKWGGDWKSFQDRPHWEVSQLEQQQLQPGGMTGPEEEEQVRPTMFAATGGVIPEPPVANYQGGGTTNPELQKARQAGLGGASWANMPRTSTPAAVGGASSFTPRRVGQAPTDLPAYQGMQMQGGLTPSQLALKGARDTRAANEAAAAAARAKAAAAQQQQQAPQSYYKPTGAQWLAMSMGARSPQQAGMTPEQWKSYQSTPLTVGNRGGGNPFAMFGAGAFNARGSGRQQGGMVYENFARGGAVPEPEEINYARGGPVMDRDAQFQEFLKQESRRGDIAGKSARDRAAKRLSSLEGRPTSSAYRPGGGTRRSVVDDDDDWIPVKPKAGPGVDPGKTSSTPKKGPSDPGEDRATRFRKSDLPSEEDRATRERGVPEPTEDRLTRFRPGDLPAEEDRATRERRVEPAAPAPGRVLPGQNVPVPDVITGGGVTREGPDAFREQKEREAMRAAAARRMQIQKEELKRKFPGAAVPGVPEVPPEPQAIPAPPAAVEDRAAREPTPQPPSGFQQPLGAGQAAPAPSGFLEPPQGQPPVPQPPPTVEAPVAAPQIPQGEPLQPPVQDPRTGYWYNPQTGAIVGTPDYRPGMGFAAGGVIPEPGQPGYNEAVAEGRTVEPIDPVEQGMPAAASMVRRAGPSAPPEGQPEDQQPERAKVRASPKMMSDVRKAVDGGVNFLQRHFGLGAQGAVPTPESQATRSSGAQRFAKGEGAADAEELQAIDSQVDPNGELSEGNRQMSRLAKTMRWYQSRGRKDEAEAAAGSLMQYGAARFSKLGSLAEVAYRNGDIDKTVQYLEKAYEMIPDGAEVNVRINQETGKIEATHTDDEGNEEFIEASPEELPGLLKQVQDKSMYWNSIFRLADPEGAKSRDIEERTIRTEQRGERSTIRQEERADVRTQEKEARAAEEKKAEEARTLETKKAEELRTEQREKNKALMQEALIRSRPEGAKEGKEKDMTVLAPIMAEADAARKAVEENDTPETQAARDLAFSKLAIATGGDATWMINNGFGDDYQFRDPKGEEANVATASAPPEGAPAGTKKMKHPDTGQPIWAFPDANSPTGWSQIE